MRLRMAALVCFALLWPLAGLADQITLTNGDRITGTILQSDAKTLTIKSDLEGQVTIQWSGVATITSTQELHLTLTDGQTVVGTVTTQDNNFAVVTKDAGTVQVAKDTVTQVRSDDEQKAYDASIERLENPRLTDLWSGMLDTGLSLTRGNSATLTYTLSAKAIRETPRDKITAYTTAIYGSEDNTTPGQTTAHEIRGGIRADINLDTKEFVFGLTDFDSNALQHLDLQNDIGGGAGYHAVKTARTTFDLFGGAAYNQEYFSAYTTVNPAPPPPTLTVAAVTQREMEILGGEDMSTKVGPDTTFAEDFTIYPGITGPGGYRFTFNSTAATKLKNWLAWQVTFSDYYLSNPPVAIKSNDLLLSTGLRFTFGKATP